MEQQISGKQFSQILLEMKEISGLDFLLYSDKAALKASTVKHKVDGLDHAVGLFLDSMAESQMVQDWIFLRVEIEEETKYVLLCSRGNGLDSSFVIGKMAVNQIKNLSLYSQNPVDHTRFFRDLFQGELSRDRIDENVHLLKLKPGRFVVYIIQFSRDSDTVVVETLKNLFLARNVDHLVELDDTRVALIKNIEGVENQDIKQYAHIIVDNLQAEAMTNVWIGYSRSTDSYYKMKQMFEEGCAAVHIGRIFYGSENVFCYDYLGLGRLIHQLPEKLCEKFLDEILGENAALNLDEETLTTINQLFENNLNISETARQLYIHRNTLVYRLERIEKKLGLDIRTFEDAMLFKIAMLVRTHLDTLPKTD